MVRPVAELPTWEEVVAIAGGHSITRLGVAPADVLDRARTEIVRRKAAGLHAGMGFTYRNPVRSTDPQQAVPGAKSIIAAARPYRLRDEPERPAGAQARVARYAWVDHYAPLRAGLREIALQIRRAGHKAVVFADDVIRDEVRRLPATRQVVVVTNDQQIVRDVRAMGANTVTSDQLLALMR